MKCIQNSRANGYKKSLEFIFGSSTAPFKKDNKSVHATGCCKQSFAYEKFSIEVKKWKKKNEKISAMKFNNLSMNGISVLLTIIAIHSRFINADEATTTTAATTTLEPGNDHFSLETSW